MEQVLVWGFSVLAVVNIAYIIYFNIVRTFSRLKCRKKKYSKYINPCHESECKFSEYCQYYEHVITDEEIDMLKELIHEMKH